MRRILLGLAALGVLLVALGPALIGLRERDDDTGVLPPAIPGRMLAVGGHHVHVVERGAGPAILLVHGFGGSTHDWEQFVLEPLARERRVLAVDLFGVGWSARRDDVPYDWTLWSDELVGVLDALGIARASVAGQSMGGAVAAVFAARHPDRIDRLVLVDALYPRPPEEVPFAFRALQTPVVGELAAGALPALVPPGVDADYAARARLWFRIAGTRRGLLSFVRDPGKLAELTAAYPRIAAPTLVIHDPKDPFVAYAAMERSAPLIRNTRIVSIPEGGHFPQRGNPEALVRLLEDFTR